MNNTLVIAGILTTGVAASYGAMEVSDNVIDSSLAQLELQNSELMTFEVIEDQNSFSNRQITIKMTADIESGPVFYLKNAINKRPWGLSIDHVLTLEKGIINQIDEAEVAQFVKNNLMDQPLLTGSSNVGLTGSYESEFITFSIKDTLDDAKVEIKPITSQVSGNYDGDMAIEFDWPGLRFSNQDINLNIDDISYDAEGRFIPGLSILGTQSMTISEVAFNSVFQPDSQVSLNAFGYEVDTKIEDGVFGGSNIISASQVSVSDYDQDFELSDVRFAVGLYGLEEKSVLNLNQIAQTFDPMTDDTSVFFKDLNNLLQYGLRFSIDEISATVNDAKFTASLSTTLAENDIAQVEDETSFAKLFPLLSASAVINMDSEIANIPFVRDQISLFIMMGFLVEDNGKYALNAQLKDGVATLNGDPLPLPF